MLGTLKACSFTFTYEMNIIIHKSYPIKTEGTTHIHALKTYMQVFAGLKKRQEATGWGNRHQMGRKKNKEVGRHGYAGRLHTQLTGLKAFEGLFFKV